MYDDEATLLEELTDDVKAVPVCTIESITNTKEFASSRSTRYVLQ